MTQGWYIDAPRLILRTFIFSQKYRYFSMFFKMYAWDSWVPVLVEQRPIYYRKERRNHHSRCRFSFDSVISREVMEVKRVSGNPKWRIASGYPFGAPSSETQRRGECFAPILRNHDTMPHTRICSPGDLNPRDNNKHGADTASYLDT